MYHLFYRFIWPNFSIFFLCCCFHFLILICKWLFLVTSFLFFIYLHSFNPTFWRIPYNSHPQHMTLPRVKVYNNHGWVRATTRLFCALSTINLDFWHKLKCTCPRRDKANTLFPENISWGDKERSIFRLKSFGSIWD